MNETPLKLSIILPIYNEVASVRQLLNMVWLQPVLNLEKELIIIESNSTDGTREIVKRFVSAHAGVKLILQPKPRGKGNAVREGFIAATGDIILIQDGDLEYDTKDYPLLIQPILDGKTDFVLGSRHLAAGSWKIRNFGNTKIRSLLMNFGGIFFHGVFNLVYGQSLTDPTTMYKVFRRRCLENLHLVSDRFDFDFELLGKLIRAGYTPFEVPILYSSRGFQDGKKIRVFRDPFTWIWAIFRFRFGKI